MQIAFMASLPPILSAVNIDGVDGNARIKLDIPGNERGAIIQLIQLQGQAFKVTIQTDAPGVEQDIEKMMTGAPHE